MITKNKKQFAPLIIIFLIIVEVVWIAIRNHPKADVGVAGTPEFAAIGAIDIGENNDFNPSQVTYTAYAGDLYSGSVTSDGNIYFATIDPGVYNLKIIGTDQDGKAYNYTYNGDLTLVVPREETTKNISYFDISNLKKGDPAPEFNTSTTSITVTPPPVEPTNTNPTVKMTSPVEGSEISKTLKKKQTQAKAKLVATASDSDQGDSIKEVFFLSKNTDGAITFLGKGSPVSNGQSTFILYLSKGSYQIYAQAQDSKDAVGESGIAKVTIK